MGESTISSNSSNSSNISKEYKDKLDKSLNNIEYDKFLVYFYQFHDQIRKKGIHNKAVVHYKTIALLYLLATQQEVQYNCLIQTCYDVNSYAIVLNVYDLINICDFQALDKLEKKTDGILQRIINLNIESLKRRTIEKFTNESSSVNKMNVKDYLGNIEDCIMVINNNN